MAAPEPNSWVTCECGRKVRVRLDGNLSRHSPIKGWRETPWCPLGEQPAVQRTTLADEVRAGLHDTPHP